MDQQVAAAPAPAADAASSESEPAAADAAPDEPEPTRDAAPDEPASPSRPDRDVPLLRGPLRTYARFDRAALARFCSGLSPGERLRVRAMLAVLEGRARERGTEPEPWLRSAADVIDRLDPPAGDPGRDLRR